MDPSFVLGEPKTTFPSVIIDPEVVFIADSYQNLDVYKLSMQFAYDVYQKSPLSLILRNSGFLLN